MGSDYSGSNGSTLEKMPTIKFTKLFVNGEFVDSVSGFSNPLSLSLSLYHLFYLIVSPSYLVIQSDTNIISDLFTENS